MTTSSIDQTRRNAQLRALQRRKQSGLLEIFGEAQHALEEIRRASEPLFRAAKTIARTINDASSDSEIVFVVNKVEGNKTQLEQQIAHFIGTIGVTEVVNGVTFTSVKRQAITNVSVVDGAPNTALQFHLHNENPADPRPGYQEHVLHVPLNNPDIVVVTHLATS